VCKCLTVCDATGNEGSGLGDIVAKCDRIVTVSASGCVHIITMNLLSTLRYNSGYTIMNACAPFSPSRSLPLTFTYVATYKQIPQFRGLTGSLNVSTSAGILFWEFKRQQLARSLNATVISLAHYSTLAYFYSTIAPL
jgi:hypothetical protein